jgi:hypothetical protein
MFSTVTSTISYKEKNVWQVIIYEQLLAAMQEFGFSPLG